MTGYSAVEVAKMFGLSADRVRAYVRAGFVAADRGPRGELRFTFSDLVLLRATRALLSARIPARRIHGALRQLRAQLPADRPLSGVRITAEGDRILVHDGRSRWRPDTGQVLFDFDRDLALPEEPVVALAQRRRHKRGTPPEDAEDWYQRACVLEETSPAEALEAYRRAVALAPEHTDAHVNLGRLLHAEGKVAEAKAHYLQAVAQRPEDAIARFNLGVALEDEGNLPTALTHYEAAVEHDPHCADAHYNAARLHERLGRHTAALRHLKAYRALTR